MKNKRVAMTEWDKRYGNDYGTRQASGEKQGKEEERNKAEYTA